MAGVPVVNGSLSPNAIRDIVLRYSRLAGLGDLAPHDLRRTFARLSRDGGASLECVSASLGHASIVTTQRYVNSTESANAGDYIKLDRVEESK